MNKESMNPIDVVFTWVNSNEAAYKQRITPYLNKIFKDEVIPEDLAGETRFRSVGEIYMSVASVIRYAPFVRKIFIVTDQQNPEVDGFVKKHFPDNTIPIEVVDHKELFKGYEQYLPVFNSLSIETMLYRIPGLSDRFVYFNDDFFLLRPIRVTDWFVGDKPVAYGYWHYTFTARLVRWLKQRKHGFMPFGFRDSMLNSADIAKAHWRFWRILHVPSPMLRTFFESYYAQHPQLLDANLRYRFRDARQFNPQALFYIVKSRCKECVTLHNKSIYLYIKPADHTEKQIQRKWDKFLADDQALFCCVNSLDLASQHFKKEILTWLFQKIGLGKVDFGHSQEI